MITTFTDYQFVFYPWTFKLCTDPFTQTMDNFKLISSYFANIFISVVFFLVLFSFRVKLFSFFLNVIPVATNNEIFITGHSGLFSWFSQWPKCCINYSSAVEASATGGIVLNGNVCWGPGWLMRECAHTDTWLMPCGGGVNIALYFLYFLVVLNLHLLLL